MTRPPTDGGSAGEPPACRGVALDEADLEAPASVLVTSTATGDGVCESLVGDVPPSETDLLFVTLTQTPDDRLAAWRATASAPPANVAIVGVTEWTRSATATSGQSGPAPMRSVGDPGDLTGLLIEIQQALAPWKNDGNQTVVCFHSLTALAQYVEIEKMYAFLNELTGLLEGAGAVAHLHVDPSAHDERTLGILTSVVDTVIEPTHAAESAGGKLASDPAPGTAAAHDPDGASDEDVAAALADVEGEWRWMDDPGPAADAVAAPQPAADEPADGEPAGGESEAADESADAGGSTTGSPTGLDAAAWSADAATETTPSRGLPSIGIAPVIVAIVVLGALAIGAAGFPLQSDPGGTGPGEGTPAGAAAAVPSNATANGTMTNTPTATPTPTPTATPTPAPTVTATPTATPTETRDQPVDDGTTDPVEDGLTDDGSSADGLIGDTVDSTGETIEDTTDALL